MINEPNKKRSHANTFRNLVAAPQHIQINMKYKPIVRTLLTCFILATAGTSVTNDAIIASLWASVIHEPNISREQRWNDTDRANRRTLAEIYRNTSSTTNTTWTGLGSKPVLAQQVPVLDSQLTFRSSAQLTATSLGCENYFFGLSPDPTVNTVYAL